jgi:tetratricopeptide (TPR) repeat protein
LRYKVLLAGSIILCLVLAVILVQNHLAQRTTDARLNQLQRQIEEQAASRGPASGASSPGATGVTRGPLIVDAAASLPTERAEKQHEVEQVMAAGWKLIDQRDPAAATEAAELFQAGITKIDGSSADLYNGLGRALLIAGKPREAIAAWRKGLAIQPKLADMQSGIGWAYWRLNDPYRAKQAWEQAVALDPRSPDAWSALAWIDLALGDKTGAVRGFKTLVDRNPQNQSWVIGLAMARAGNTDVAQIRLYFGMPELAAFEGPRGTIGRP